MNESKVSLAIREELVQLRQQGQPETRSSSPALPSAITLPKEISKGTKSSSSDTFPLLAVATDRDSKRAAAAPPAAAPGAARPSPREIFAVRGEPAAGAAATAPSSAPPPLIKRRASGSSPEALLELSSSVNKVNGALKVAPRRASMMSMEKLESYTAVEKAKNHGPRRNSTHAPTTLMSEARREAIDAQYGVTSVLIEECKHDRMALIKACKAKDILLALELLRTRHFDVNLADTASGASALMHAVIGGSVHLVKLLVAYGANIETPNNCGDRVLHTAFYRGWTRIIKFLIGEGADLEAKNRLHQTPPDMRKVIVDPGLPPDGWEDTSGVFVREATLSTEQLALERRVGCLEQIGSWRYETTFLDVDPPPPSVKDVETAPLKKLIALATSRVAVEARNEKKARSMKMWGILRSVEKVASVAIEGHTIALLKMNKAAVDLEARACNAKLNDLLRRPNDAKNQTVWLCSRSMKKMRTEVRGLKSSSKDTRVKALLELFAGPWTEWRDRFDRPFFYNTKTHESSWSSPAGYITIAMRKFFKRAEHEKEEEEAHKVLPLTRSPSSWYAAALRGDLDSFVEERVVGVIHSMLWTASSTQKAPPVMDAELAALTARERATLHSEEKRRRRELHKKHRKKKKRFPRRMVASIEERVLRQSACIAILSTYSKKRSIEHLLEESGVNSTRRREKSKFEQLCSRVPTPAKMKRAFALRPLARQLKQLPRGVKGLQELAAVTESVMLGIAGLMLVGDLESVTMAKLIAYEFVSTALKARVMLEPTRLLGQQFFETGIAVNPMFSITTNASMSRLGRLMELDFDKAHIRESTVAKLVKRVDHAIVKHAAHRVHIGAYTPPTGLPEAYLEQVSTLTTHNMRPVSAPASILALEVRTPNFRRQAHDRAHGARTRRKAPGGGRVPRWAREYESALDARRIAAALRRPATAPQRIRGRRRKGGDT